MRAALLAACAALSTASSQAQTPEDAAAVTMVANALDMAVDDKDWNAALAFFTETIVTELPGQERAEAPASDLVDGWARALFDEKESYHLRGGHVVTFSGPDDARLRSKAYAYNRLTGEAAGLDGGNLYEVWGDYDYDLVRTEEGWRISRFAYTPRREAGSAAVPAYVPE